MTGPPRWTAIYEDAYRRLIVAALEFGEAEEHRQHLRAARPLAARPLQVAETLIVELWADARTERPDSHYDAMMARDRHLHAAVSALTDVIDHLYAVPR